MSSDWLDEWKTASGAASTEEPGNPADNADQPHAQIPSAQPSPAAVEHTSAGRARGVRDRRKLYPLLALAGLLLVVVVGVLALTGRGNDAPESITIPAQPPLSTMPASPSVASAMACTETNTPTRLVTAKPGDTQTAAGLIAAFEHAYFTERDPIAAAEYLAPEMRVSAGAIRGVMDANFPPGEEPVPYCATVTPWSNPNTWAVTVDWIDERTSEARTWNAVYEVKTVNGQLRITSERTTD